MRDEVHDAALQCPPFPHGACAAFVRNIECSTAVTLPNTNQSGNQPGNQPGSAPFLLGINVHAYYELPDARLLAIENHVYNGSWNRLVVIDESAQTKKWVMPAVTDFLITPDNQEFIADVVSGATGFDILRANVPTR